MKSVYLISLPAAEISAHDVFSQETAAAFSKLGYRCRLLYYYPNWFGKLKFKGRRIFKRNLFNWIFKHKIYKTLTAGDLCMVLNALDSSDSNHTAESLIQKLGATYCMFLQDNHFARSGASQGYLNRARTADHLLVVTPQLHEAAIKHGIDAKKIKIVEEPVSLTRLRKSMDISETPNLVWTGNPGNLKNLKLIAKALEEVYASIPFHLMIISGNTRPQFEFNFPWNWRAYSFEQENFDLEGFWGGLAPIEKNDYTYCKGNFKVKTYFAKGIPVVASDFGFNENLIDHGINGFLCSSCQDWVCAISRLLSSKESVVEMSDNARKKAELYYSHDRCVSGWIKQIGGY